MEAYGDILLVKIQFLISKMIVFTSRNVIVDINNGILTSENVIVDIKNEHFN